MTCIDVSDDRTTGMPRFFAQFLLIVFGAALVVSSFAVWLVPTAEGLPEVTLLKIGVTTATLIGGLCCIVLAKEAKRGRL